VKTHIVLPPTVRRERRAVPRLPRWLALALAALCGAAQAISFAPWELGWLQLLATGGLVGLLVHERPRVAAMRAWVFAWAWLGVGMWWLFISLHRYGGLPSWMSVAAVVLLAGLLALYYALAAAAWAWTRRRTVQTDALLFAAWWLAAELARAQFLTGFPWIASGYAHTTGPFAAWAPYIGVYGIGALATWCAAVVALGVVGLRNGRWGLFRSISPLLGPAALLVVGALLPQDFTRSTGALRVTLLQTNVPQDLKFDVPHIQAALDSHRTFFGQAKGDLVVTPESSLPLPAAQVPPDDWEQYQRPFDTPGRGLLVGVFTGDDEHGWTNSVIGLSAEHRMPPGTSRPAYHYGKRHLLPFGEFIPPGAKWFVDLMHIPIGDQLRGTETASFAVHGQRVRPLICYEDLFGEDFAASMVGPDAATMMANVTNLAWFGPLMVQDQHLQFSRMRALEFQRPQVRATNTGATAVIDYRGRVTARLPADVLGVLDTQVEGRIGDTPYGRWLSRWHLWPLWGVLAAVIVLSRFVRGR
jgi:apolipoprotein N-acyltransferase